MEKAWKRVLAKYRLPYFHMVDCAHGNGVFAELPKAKRDNAARAMFGLIEKYVTWGIAFACPPRRHVKGEELEDSYAFSLRNCCLMISAIMETEIPGESFSLVFEDGHDSAADGVRAMQRFQKQNAFPKLSSFSFVKKTDNVLLQAADILAWQLAKNIKDKAFSERKPRKDFERLFANKHTVIYSYMGDDRYHMMLDKMPAFPEPKRDWQIREIFRGGEFSEPTLKALAALDLPEGALVRGPGVPKDVNITRPSRDW